MISEPQRMDKVIITVDGVECYEFLNGTSNTPAQKNITCKRPLTGSIVRFSKKGDTNLDYYLNFCEVQVWGNYNTQLNTST